MLGRRHWYVACDPRLMLDRCWGKFYVCTITMFPGLATRNSIQGQCFKLLCLGLGQHIKPCRSIDAPKALIKRSLFQSIKRSLYTLKIYSLPLSQSTRAPASSQRTISLSDNPETNRSERSAARCAPHLTTSPPPSSPSTTSTSPTRNSSP